MEGWPCADPRDSIKLVCVWSQREQAFVTSIRTEADVFGTILAPVKRTRRGWLDND